MRTSWWFMKVNALKLDWIWLCCCCCCYFQVIFLIVRSFVRFVSFCYWLFIKYSWYEKNILKVKFLLRGKIFDSIQKKKKKNTRLKISNAHTNHTNTLCKIKSLNFDGIASVEEEVHPFSWNLYKYIFFDFFFFSIFSHRFSICALNLYLKFNVNYFSSFMQQNEKSWEKNQAHTS